MASPAPIASLSASVSTVCPSGFSSSLLVLPVNLSQSGYFRLALGTRMMQSTYLHCPVEFGASGALMSTLRRNLPPLRGRPGPSHPQTPSPTFLSKSAFFVASLLTLVQSFALSTHAHRDLSSPPASFSSSLLDTSLIT